MKLGKWEHSVFIFSILYTVFMLFFIPIQLKTIPWAVVILEFLHFVILIYCIRSYNRMLPGTRLRRKEYKKNRITNLIILFNIEDHDVAYFSFKRLPEYHVWLNDKLYEFHMLKYR